MNLDSRVMVAHPTGEKAWGQMTGFKVTTFATLKIGRKFNNSNKTTQNEANYYQITLGQSNDL